MIKQTLVAGAALLLAAVPAFASVSHNHAHVWTSVESTATSGDNNVTAYGTNTAHYTDGANNTLGNGNLVGTGNSSNGTLVVTGANSTTGDGSVRHNHAHVATEVTSTATSGDNNVTAYGNNTSYGGGTNSLGNSNTLSTGDSSNQTGVVTVVNSSVSL